MPEIKNTFIEGKMNKDLDERLVPKGQYIDAMNVEVTTSEDSDVGTVQNIYGNVSVTGNYLVPGGAVCIGSVVNEATDSLYWLTATDKATFLPGPDQLIQNANIVFEYNKTNSPLVNPVFVDVHQVVIGEPSNPSNGPYYYDQPWSTSYFWIDNEINVYVGMTVYVNKGGTKYRYGKIVDLIPSDGTTFPITSMQVVVDGDFDLFESGTPTWQAIIFEGNVTEWNRNTQVTGINIVDDMLFWTDNETEPKKINIPRSKEGTFQYTSLANIKHTQLIANDSPKGPISKEDITVIKQKPSKRINLEMKSKREVNSGVYGYVRMNGRKTGNNTEVLSVGDTKTLGTVFTMDTSSFNGVDKFDYRVGDVMLLKFSSAQPNVGAFPITHNYNIKAKITDILDNEFINPATSFKIKILDVNYAGYPGSTGTAADYYWSMQKELNEDQLFELKFPRFSYRWKYEDGEYSSFAPWSNIAFLPGEYRYLPKEGFNTGMVNELRELTLVDFVSPSIPREVSQIDLLYKESDSPNVYIVDSLRIDDPTPIACLLYTSPSPRDS